MKKQIIITAEMPKEVKSITVQTANATVIVIAQSANKG